MNNFFCFGWSYPPIHFRPHGVTQFGVPPMWWEGLQDKELREGGPVSVESCFQKLIRRNFRL